MPSYNQFIVLFLLHFAVLAAGQRNPINISNWLTLDGQQPKIVARGGTSGIFPDSSKIAYNFASLSSLRDVIFWCDVQLTKDQTGLCFPNLHLENSSNIGFIYPNKSNTYTVDGTKTTGYFSVDFTIDDLSNVSLRQGIFSRTAVFDPSQYPIMTVEDVAQMKPSGLWLNIQNDKFFRERKLDTRGYIISLSKVVVINYISSPDFGFLKSLSPRLNQNVTKLIFRFLGSSDVEPSTNQSYSSLLQNMTSFKDVVEGFLLPKSYIWPVDASGYLQAQTTVVQDAHKSGFIVCVENFANDIPYAYDLGYNPVNEYLGFIDNDNFSADILLSDFPSTASLAIDCFSHINKSALAQATPLVLSYNGASGIFPGCTDDAYESAISDGVDYLDCNVQMSKDSIAFCMSSIDVLNSTNAAQSNFINLITTIPEIKVTNGIASFNLTWSEIQTLKPQISSPQAQYFLFRNPKAKNDGNFLTLSQFLNLAGNASSLPGVLISIENADFLAEQGLDVINSVLVGLRDAGYGKNITKKVLIQSTDSSVLKKLQNKGNFELVYSINEDIKEILNSAVEEIKNLSSSVVLTKNSVFPKNLGFLTGVTDIVEKLQSHGLLVYGGVFSDEFTSQAWDHGSDPFLEINSFVMGAGLNGIITDFPATAALYKKSRCLTRAEVPSYFRPVQPGFLLENMAPEAQPPALPPMPILRDSDIAEPPISPTSTTNRTNSIPPSSSGGLPQCRPLMLFIVLFSLYSV